jgi:hypothetical protein
MISLPAIFKAIPFVFQFAKWLSNLHRLLKSEPTLELCLPANKCWEITRFGIKSIRKEMIKLHKEYSKTMKANSIQSHHTIDPRWKAFLNVDDYLGLVNKPFGSYQTLTRPSNNLSSFSICWFDFCGHGLYWQSIKVIERAFKECKKVECLAIKPTNFLPGYEYPAAYLCEIEFRFRNTSNKTIHLTGLTADTVAILQLGAASGSGQRLRR